MMKTTFSILAFLFITFGCTTNAIEEEAKESYDNRETPPEAAVLDSSMFSIHDSIKESEHAKTFTNNAFRNVTIKEIKPGKFTVSGQARVFEAAFSWVIEDGMNEISEGHETTDAGAPAWGNFSFDVSVSKESENSTLHIILFESSAKDGSRINELPIFLY